MKKFLLMFCLVILLCGSSCSQNQPSPSSEENYLPFSGLEWGMTKEEIITALNLNADQLISYGEGSFGYKTDEVLFGKPLYAISFQMAADPRADTSTTPRLQQIRIAYAENTPETFSIVKSSLAAQFGEAQDSRKIVDSGDEGLRMSTQSHVEQVAYWYSPQTVGSLPELTKDRLKDISSDSFDATLANRDKESYWKAFQDTALVRISLDCRDPANASYKSAYGELVFDGTYAYYARILGEQGTASESN